MGGGERRIVKKQSLPIVLSPTELHQVLAGERTLIHRLVTLPDRLVPSSPYPWWRGRYLDLSCWTAVESERAGYWLFHDNEQWLGPVRCPWGARHGELWVKEDFRRGNGLAGVMPARIHGISGMGPVISRTYMKRHESSLRLMVHDIVPHRLNDIRPEEAVAAGIHPVHTADGIPAWRNYRRYSHMPFFRNPIASFESRWDLPYQRPRPHRSRKRYDSYWNLSPWVWAISFSAMERRYPASTFRPIPSKVPIALRREGYTLLEVDDEE